MPVNVLLKTSSDGTSEPDRYARRREEFINAATDVLNRHGINGMTIEAVASQLNLTTPSIRHYFKRKQDLAAACVLSAIDRVDAMISAAGTERDAEARIGAFVRGYLELLRDARAGKVAPIANFSEVKTLTAQGVTPVAERFFDMIQRVRALITGDRLSFLDRDAQTLRVMYLFVTVTWAGAWVQRYDIEDYLLVAERVTDLILNGFVSDAEARWAPIELPPLEPPLPPPSVRPIARETYLHAATQLINEQGYRGASVDKIAEMLHVTKGAFYHHHEAKSDLIDQCFHRTNAIVRRAQRDALELQESGWEQLMAAMSALVEFQLSPNGPLLSSTAISALPDNVWPSVREKWEETSTRFALMIGNGVVDGSLRRIDPTVAGQVLNVAVNAMSRLRGWLPKVDAPAATALYLRPMLYGIFAR